MVGLVPRGHTDRAAFQELDLRAVFGSVAKSVEICEDAARLPIGALLAEAERPLLLLGGSRWTDRARADIRDWAESWELPVAVDFRCQDLVDDSSPSYIGYFAFGRSPRLARRLAEADLLLCGGAAPGDVLTEGCTLLDNRTLRLVQALPEAQPPGALHRAELAVLRLAGLPRSPARRRGPARPGRLLRRDRRPAARGRRDRLRRGQLLPLGPAPV